MRNFLIAALVVGLCLSASLSFGEPYMYWYPCSDAPGWFLTLNGLDCPAGTEIVFNELTFENVHNISDYGGIGHKDCLWSWDSAYYYEAPTLVPGYPATPFPFPSFPENAKYDTFLTFSSPFISSLPKIKELPFTSVETNDGTNPGGLDLAYEQIAGMGDLSMGFTAITGNVGAGYSDPLVFAYTADPSYAFSGYYPRTYVTLDITVNGENYLWMHQPIGWIESALPRPETDPVDGKLGFGNVRIGTTVEKNVTIYDSYSPYEYPWDTKGEFQQSNHTHFTYTPMDHGEDREWLGSEGIFSYDFWDWTSVYFDCTGRGVGPVFESDIADGSTIDFGEVPLDSFFDVFIEIANITEDEELGELTQLAFLAEIEGEDADLFEIVGITNGTLLVGESTKLALRFNGTGLTGTDVYDANLIIHTDVGAAAGETGLGECYTFAMTAATVPEPSILVALLGIVAGFFAWNNASRQGKS